MSYVTPRRGVVFLFALMMLLGLGGCGYSDPLHERHQLLKMLWTERYAELDQALATGYEKYQRGKITGARFTSWFWQLEHADPAFAQRYQKWVETMPDSGWAHLTRGLFLVQRAYQERGDRVASETPDGRFERMEDYLSDASDELEIAAQHLPRCALCIGGQLNVNLLRGERRHNRELIDQALGYDLNIWRPVYAYYTSLYPQWGGSEAEMQAFAREVGLRIPELGKRLEALFYWQRGLNYGYAGRSAEQIESFRLAADTFPSDEVLKSLAGAYMEQGDFEAAIPVLEQNLEVNDEWDLWSLESLHQAYVATGEDGKARRILSRRDEYLSRYHRGE